MLPNFEEMEAAGYKFSHISSMNAFRAFVATHLISERLNEL